jgi:hypothetical protein
MSRVFLSRVTRPLLAVALFAFASFASADSLRLLAPEVGTTLRGGSFAELRWSAAQLPASAEEWEAFLSIDGGTYYAFRVTPHLEIDLQRFTFIVPNVDTRNAKILIRVGDEKRETHFDLPGSFSITRDPEAELALPLPTRFERGEAAREGDPGVVGWTDGARNGSGLTQQSSTSVPLPAIDHLTVVTSDEEAELAPAEDSAKAPSIANTLRAARNRPARRAEPLPAPADLLLVCRRRNI